MLTYPAGGIADISRSLHHRFIDQWSDGSCYLVRMVVIVLARPEVKVSRDEVLAHINYWNAAAGSHIDFFFVGWSQEPSSLGDVELLIPGKTSWYFDAENFHAACTELKNSTKWRYEGETELLITNARFDPDSDSVSLDFSSTVCCRLENMLKDKAIPSVGGLFQKIFSFAESQSGDDPTWGFSDDQGVKAAGSALKEFVLSLIPEWLRGEYQKAAHFTITNVAPTKV